ncbi:hypothetical protein [Glacieibacterium sp.]|uniref:hypothetical protein n=1 Tax=Glacieibacterium sp. TaxID=2860237 RepID=UPI003AFFC0E8
MTFTGFRHGGATELGDAGTIELRPISRHKTLVHTSTCNELNDEKGRGVAGQHNAQVDCKKRD